MTEERLKEIQRLCKNATAGPWCWEATGEKSNDWCLGTALDAHDNPCSGQVDDTATVVDFICYKEEDAGFANPRFIAEARTAVPELLAEVAMLTELLENLAFCGSENPGTDWVNLQCCEEDVHKARRHLKERGQ